VNDKTANSNVTEQTPSMDNVQITLNKHKEITFGVDDFAQALANRSIIDSYFGQAIIRLAEQIEGDLLGLTSGFTTNTPINAGSALTEDDVLSARKTLTQQRAPESSRVLVIEPGQYNELLKLDRFTRNDAYGPNGAIATGRLGSIHGFDVYESIHINSAGSPTTYDNAAMHPMAMALVMRPFKPSKVPGASANISQVTDPESGLSMRVEFYRDSKQKADMVSVDVLYGVGVYREEMGIEINTT
jgi:N4-gp56 family major capsid protein